MIYSSKEELLLGRVGTTRVQGTTAGARCKQASRVQAEWGAKGEGGREGGRVFMRKQQL